MALVFLAILHRRILLQIDEVVCLLLLARLLLRLLGWRHQSSWSERWRRTPFNLLRFGRLLLLTNALRHKLLLLVLLSIIWIRDFVLHDLLLLDQILGGRAGQHVTLGLHLLRLAVVEDELRRYLHVKGDLGLRLVPQTLLLRRWLLLHVGRHATRVVLRRVLNARLEVLLRFVLFLVQVVLTLRVLLVIFHVVTHSI